jgi:hypothetical protein
MTTTYSNAVDEINSMFWTDWNSAKTSGLAGYVPEVRWQYVEGAESPDGSKFWARVSSQSVFEEQTALAGNDGTRRYTASGVVVVQLYCPKSLSQVGEIGRKLSTVARDAFRGKSTAGNVWFRNARINELAPEENVYRFNIVADFEYDEIG